MIDEKPQLHNRYKLPFFTVCLVTGAVMAIGGAITGLKGLVITGVSVAVASVVPISVIVRGKGNPSWMRSRFDPPQGGGAGGSAQPRQRTLGGSERGERTRIVLALAGSVGFVLVGIGLLAYGAVTQRWDTLLAGALGVVFFGACAWIGAAYLRGSL